MPRRAPLTLSALLAAGAVHAQSGELDAALAQATVLASQQRPGDAAAVLAPFATRYPDDHALALRLGWLLAAAGEHRAARGHYARALALSAGESRDARLGLAWSALRSDDPAAAAMEFESLLALDPANASAREGLALARAAMPRAVRAWASLWTSAQLYAHPTRRASFSLTPSLTLTFGDRVLFGVTWRALAYGYVTAANQRNTLGSWQHELFVTAGYVRPEFTAQLHYGHVWDAANPSLSAHIVGLSGRVNLRGELRAELSVSAYRDGVWGRAWGLWEARLSDAWSLGPSVSAQAGASGFGGSLGASVTLRQPRFSLTLAGRVSDETRMTSLSESMTFATNDSIRGALSVSGRVPLGRGLALAPSYEWLRLETTDGAAADAHFFTLGLTGAW